MSNSIALSKHYVPALDKVFKKAATSSILDSDASVIRQGAQVNEIIIPKISMDGLGDYSRNSGYTKGDVTLTWQTKTFNYDRGRKFEVDYLDNEESAELAFGQLAAEFQRTKVAPEADAFTYAKIASITGISIVGTPTTLADGAEFLAALLVATNKQDEDEVPEEGRILFATPTLVNSIMALDTTKSREVLAKFSSVVKVPQSRFYTAITLKDGSTSGEEIGGYSKATAGKDINFLIVHKPAIIKYDKHTANDIITPAANQNSDAYMQKYRKYGIVEAYENKVAGIYLHHKA